MSKLKFRLCATLICMLMICTNASASSVFGSGMTLLSTKTLMFDYKKRAEKALLREQEEKCLALGLYHEARGEPVVGQYAVGATILNRVNQRPTQILFAVLCFKINIKSFAVSFLSLAITF